MNYEAFCENLSRKILEKMEEKTMIQRNSIRKNNGVQHDALCVVMPGSNCAPIVYLEPLYRHYREGSTIDSITGSVVSGLKKKLPFTRERIEEMNDFKSAGPGIAFRLISRKENEALLSDVPWLPYLDLAIVFFVMLDTDGENQVTSLIHNRQADAWKKSAEDLFRTALDNMPGLYPPCIRRLTDILEEKYILDMSVKEDGAEECPLYVLTNKSGLHGAACVLYPDVLKDFAEQLGADLIILPSSIHEVLLVPDLDFFQYSWLREIVQSVNRDEVSPEDRLSDEVYRYTRRDNTIKVV